MQFRLPTPPKETIGGTKGHHKTAATFMDKQYRYLLDLKDFAESTEYSEEDQSERDMIESEYDLQYNAYEALRKRVENY